MKILTRTQVPDLRFETVGGETFDLKTRSPKNFTLLIVYRGHHCPLCKKQLQEYDELAERFQKIGVDLVAVSANDKALGERAATEWELTKFPIGYGLPIEEAKNWGLHISSAAKDSEPAFFTEPGLFVIRPNGELYASSIQTMPFSRASAAQLLGSLEWIIENDYPARGEAG